MTTPSSHCHCRCPGCLPSLRPDPATATTAEVFAHAEHLRKLAAIGALPDPAFQPYPPATHAMPAPLIIPDHLRHARLALLAAGVAVDSNSPAFAALMCAAVAYNRLPQVNRAAMLSQQLAEVQRENRRLAKELLREGNRADRLAARLNQPTQP